MSLFSLFCGILSANRRRDRSTAPAARVQSFRPRLEMLEAREVPAFLTPTQYDTGATQRMGPTAIATADFNADGAADLAVVNFGGGKTSVAILMNKGDGTFLSPLKVALASAPRSVGVGDFNADGRTDIVVAGVGYPTSRLSVLLNPGNKGNWRVNQEVNLTAPATALGQEAASLAVGDFDGNGLPDVAVTSRMSFGGTIQGYTHVLTSSAGNKPGQFNLSLLGSTALSPVFNNADDLTDRQPTGTWTAVGDFDGDGRQEILSSVRGRYLNSDTYLTGVSADGSLRAPVQVGATGPVAIADFNRDGDLDFICGGEVRLGNGNGTFAPAQVVYTQYRTSVAVGDFNGDEVPDLVAGGGGDREPSSVYLGNGDGTFRDAGEAPVPASYGLAVGAFNRDSRPDIVGINYNYLDPGLFVSFNDGEWV